MESTSKCNIESESRFRKTKSAAFTVELVDSNNNIGAKNRNSLNNEQCSATHASKFCSTFQNSVFSKSTARKLSIKADYIMRLLRQISLDSGILHRNSNSHSSSSSSSTPQSPSASSTSKTNYDQNQADRLSSSFMRHLCLTINQIQTLLLSESLTKAQEVVSKPDTPFKFSSKSSSSAEKRSDILKALEEFNSLIVQLIQLSDINERNKLKSSLKKSKSKIKRQYSAFFEGGNRFRKKSLNRRASELNLITAVNGNGNNGGNNGTNNHSSNGFSDDSQSNNNELEDAVQEIINSKVLRIMLDSIADLRFEEKKMVRIILTNALILEVNKVHLIVDYFCDPSSEMLKNLIHSYEVGRSDVTLNCGRILRFSSQYRPIVTTILKSDFLYDFFQYMKRSPTNYPFDVAMDVFYTFKNVLTRHKNITIDVLNENSDQFFAAFIDLLAHADQTENYVTKRQSLEIFADIFSGNDSECNEFRRKFITQPQYIFPVILYLWNRNLQIRLRCLVLLNQLFCMSRKTITEDNGDTKHTNDKDSKIDSNDGTKENHHNNTNHNNNVSNNNNNKDYNCDCPAGERSPPSSPTSKTGSQKRLSKLSKTAVTEPLVEWQIELLITQVGLVQEKYTEQDDTIQCDLIAMFAELKAECKKSNIKQFMSQNTFVDKIIDTLSVAKMGSVDLHQSVLHHHHQ